MKHFAGIKRIHKQTHKKDPSSDWEFLLYYNQIIRYKRGRYPMPYCTACGAEYKQGAKFCGECGAATEDNAPAAARRPAAGRVSGGGAEVQLWQGKPAGISDRLKGLIRLNTTTYTITSQRIMVKTGLIGKDVEEIELLRVNDFSVDQSIPDRILGIGTLTIFSDDASSPQLLFRKIRKVQTVKDVLRKAVRDEKIANNISYREQI
jgi:hypothetical protein